MVSSPPVSLGIGWLFYSLWRDNWASECLDDLLPNIAHFAKFPDMSVKDISEVSCLEDLFVIPISQAAALELDNLRDLVHAFSLTSEPDQRIFCRGNCRYTAAKLLQTSFLVYASFGCFSHDLEVEGDPTESNSLSGLCFWTG